MRAIASCLTSLFALTACLGGGGGGGSGGSPTPFDGLNLPLSGNPADFESAEYRRSGALEPINASTVYAAGGTGAGVTVGIIDTGIDTGHPEFAGAIHPASVDLLRNGALVDGSGHGTAVAGLLGARRNGAATHGMAFDSSLLVVRADLPGSCPSACLFSQNTLAAATDHAVANGARVLNFSLGEANSLADSFRQSLGAAAAADRVLVFAAGNGGGSSPQQPALFATTGAARGTGIIVGSVNDASVISAFSNRAGGAADVFIVAPGEALRTTAVGGGSATVTGTSAATPLVAGAAAALVSAAPHLSAANVVTILLESASDLGAPGTDPIYGRGMLDLARALAPIGSLRLPEGVSTAAVGPKLSASHLALGDAFGAALPKSGPVMALDAFDRGYEVALPATTSRSSASALPGLLRRQQVGTTERLEGAGLSLDVARQGFLEERAIVAESDVTGLAATWRLDEALTVRAALGEAVAPGAADRLGLWQQRQGGGQTLSHVDLAAPASFAVEAPLDEDWRVSLTLAGDPGGGFAAMAGDQRDWATDPGGYAEPKRGRLAAFGLARGGAATGGWRIGLGLLDEADGPLGSSGSGALATGGAVTQFVDVAASWPVTSGLEAFGRAALGRTETSGQSGLLADVGPLWSTAFEVGVAIDSVARADDRLSFTVSQPLRVEAGKAVLDVPVARDVEGNVARARRALDLQPGGREIDLEIGYGTAFGSFAGGPGHLRTALMLRLAPDHDPSAPPELLFALGYRLSF
jgi:hypothetical protein